MKRKIPLTSLIILAAMGPCPCPSETVCMLDPPIPGRGKSMWDSSYHKSPSTQTSKFTDSVLWMFCSNSTVRAPVFGRHQFFGTSEHYGKAHGSLLSGWMNYNYTACWWFPTSSNILILPITVLTNQVWKLLIALFKVPNTGALTVHISLQDVFCYVCETPHMAVLQVLCLLSL